MPTKQQLESALINAHKAGNTQAANRLATAIKQGNYDQGGIPSWMGATRLALQGATFGLADELASGITAGVVAPFDENRSFKEIYDDSMADFKREREGFKEENPALATIAEIGGALATGGLGMTKALSKLAPTGSSIARKGAAMAGIGAAEGGLYGAATSDDRVSGAMSGGAMGGVLGVAAPPLLGLLGGTTKNVGKWAYKKITDTPKKEVEQALRVAADAEGLDSNEIVNLLDDLGPEATLMDLGDNFRMLASTQVSKVGPAKTQIKEFIGQRQKGQQGRLLDTIEDASGLSAKDFKGSVNALSQRMKEEAAPLYKAAYETPFEVTPKIQAILETPTGKKALKAAEEDFLDRTGTGFSGGNLEILDMVKRKFFDLANTQARAGATNKASAIGNLRKELTSEMDAAVPEYAQARKVWEVGSNIKESAELGTKIFKTPPDTLADEIADMTNAEKRLFKMGGMRAVEDALENRGISGDAGKFLSDKPIMKKRLGLLFDDKDSVNAVQKQINAEAAFSETKRQVKGGSPTHERQESARIFDGASAALRGDTIGATIDAVRLIGKNKMTPEAVADLTNTLLDQGLSKKRIMEIFNSKDVTKAAGRNLGSEVGKILKYSPAPLGALFNNEE